MSYPEHNHDPDYCDDIQTGEDASREAAKRMSVRGPSPDTKDVVCEHGTAMDVHCCNCHSGFLFDAECVCVFDLPKVRVRGFDRLLKRLGEILK